MEENTTPDKTTGYEGIYPYQTDLEAHPLAWVFFYIAGLAVSMEVANDMARHVFDDLGCGGPGTAHAPTVKYDALGGGGAPWEPGMWIDVDEPRQEVIITAPDKDVSAMDAAERAELRAALDAAEDKARAEAAETVDRFDGDIAGDTTGEA